MSDLIRYVQRPPKNDMQLFTKGIAALPQVLRQLGYPSLRKGQDSVVHGILMGRDSLCVLPTATGKTACYVVPTLALKWRTLVFSPLIALMRDQVQNMVDQGVRAGCLMSGEDALNQEYMRLWARGELDILLVAPERLLNEQFKEIIRQKPPDMVAMDEAHCLSQWSRTFRSAYCMVGDFITQTAPRVVAAFTATCPPRVEADIRRVMCLEQALKTIYYPRRSNLDLRSTPFVNDYDFADWVDKMQKSGPVIIYAATTKSVEQLAQKLGDMVRNLNIGFYHGQMTKSMKTHNQDMFLHGDMRVIVATNAFGMGIDKPNVRAVLHYDISDSVESWAQEFGRAGRDGKDSICMTFFSQRSVGMRKFLMSMNNPPEDAVMRVFNLMRKNITSDGMVQLSRDDIIKQALPKNISHFDAVMQFLSGCLVVQREKREEKIAGVKFLNNLDEPRYKEVRRCIFDIGTQGSDPAYVDFDLVHLANQVGLKESTLRSHLNNYAKEGLIDFVPPDRARPIRMLSTDPRLIDLDVLREQTEASEHKLQRVIYGVTEVPDSEKHAFIEKEFMIENQA